ncbi:MAG: DUF2283 domain-containing protein [Aridibacter sp.]
MAAEIKTNDFIELAQKRGKVPNDWVKLEYQKDVDLLFILYSNKRCVRSRGAMENGIIYNYDAQDELVSIEVLDLYGVFATV